MLEVAGVGIHDALLDGWRARVERARTHLGWPRGPVVVRRHDVGASLAFAAPPDQLFAATEANEWALCATLFDRDPVRWSGLEVALAAAQPGVLPPAVLDEPTALARLVRLAAGEARPALRALLAAAAGRRLSHLLDEELLTLGEGEGARSWPLAALPAVDAVPWAELHRIPVAVVTGSNGKTTTVRLIAACAKAHGWCPGYSSTEGLYVDGVLLDAGDYSGPVGTRSTLRDQRVAAAVLEVARGGILRRGLALGRADAAVVTNISADHFGEYGIRDLGALADVKLTVARVVGSEGLLVLNADDEILRDKGARLDRPIGWFALDDDCAALRSHRAIGGVTCGVRAGRLVLSRDGGEHDLGAVAAMPLAVGGSADYNVANLAAAALGAAALGIAPAIIAEVFARFGADPTDNVGRLMRDEIGGVQLLIDYAHNPAGMRGLLRVARYLRPQGRLAVLLGQAGNREDADLRHLAGAVAGFAPDLVVVKEEPEFLRGRAAGEVPAILSAALLAAGVPAAAITFATGDGEAARCALSWSRPGDVLALLVHSRQAREGLLGLIERLRCSGWVAGDALPQASETAPAH